MKEERCYIIAQITNLIIIYIICLTVIFFGEYVLKRTPGLLLALIPAVLLAYVFFLRSVIGNFILYAALHIPPAALFWFIPWQAGKAELMAFYVILAFLDLAHWIRKQKDAFAYVPIIYVLINAAAYLFASVKKNSFGMILFFVLGILYFLLFYIRLFYANAAVLSKERIQDEKMPFKDMLKNAAVAAFPFVAVSVAVMIFVRIDALDSVALAVYEFVLQLVTVVARIIIRIVEFLAGILLSGSGEEITEQAGEMLQTQTPQVLKIISAVIYYASVALLLYLFVRLVISLIKWIPMRKKFTREVIEQSDMIEIRERIIKSKTVREEKLSPVRRRYKTTIEKAAKKGYEIKKYHTPKERTNDLMIQKSEDISELSALYEAERYRLQNKI